MILVDSGVWIDFFRGTASPQAEKLDSLLGIVPLAIGDLILTEVLLGCDSTREFNEVRKVLSTFAFVTLGGPDVAVEAARNFRLLRARGITVRKTIDTVIATRCIFDGYELLHKDRDFEGFVALGLKCVVCEA